MTSRFSRLAKTLLAVFLVLAIVHAEDGAGQVMEKGALALDEELEKCSIVQTLTQQKRESQPPPSSAVTNLLNLLFPSQNAAVNALLATLYISGPPNFLLALCPPNIDPSSLSIMVAFAVGGLLGDTLFHLLPEIFLGEDEPDKVRFVLLEPRRNLLLGVAIMVGFMTFVAMDKGLRILTGGEGHDHNHGMTRDTHVDTKMAVNGSTGVDVSQGAELKQRKKAKPNEANDEPTAVPAKSDPAAAKSLLPLLADFTHNITDGLALASSFYASRGLGTTTTLAIFFHEIPHEVGDFALLIQSGFSKKAAMGAQFVTALGALLGTVIGIVVQEYGGVDASSSGGSGVLGTSLSWGDLLLPFTAGTFLYVGTVAVVPDLLETGPNKAAELRKTITQFLAVAAGAGIMLGISW